MICPYCGKPMEKGFLASNNQISGIPWLPEGGKLPLNPYVSTSSIYNQKGIVLADIFVTRETLALTSWLCRDCGKGVFDIADNRYIFNKDKE